MERRCPVCGLTRDELLATGLLGCETCYKVFALEIEQAVQALHGVAAPREPNPWPTRRAVPAPEPARR